MDKTKLAVFGVAAVLAIGAYFGVENMLAAQAKEDARIEVINQARTALAYLQDDEARFGTGFRDAALACMDEATDKQVPKLASAHMVSVLKEAITLASDENFTPRNPARWFAEAQRLALSKSPVPDAAYAGLEANAKDEAEAALGEINGKMNKIGACLLETARL